MGNLRPTVVGSVPAVVPDAKNPLGVRPHEVGDAAGKVFEDKPRLRGELEHEVGGGTAREAETVGNDAVPATLDQWITPWGAIRRASTS